jgi:fatty-acid peroxygenase
MPRGGLVILDVYGTNHDPRHWPDPQRFDPQRFPNAPVNPDTLMPQGGGTSPPDTAAPATRSPSP